MMKTLLKSGTIYDGKGNEPFVGDVLIAGDKRKILQPNP